LLYFLRMLIPGRSWWELILSSVLMMLAYAPLSLLFITPRHRARLFGLLRLSRNLP
jgi:hypothetical protein